MNRFIPSRKPSYSIYPPEPLTKKKEKGPQPWPEYLEFDSIPPQYSQTPPPPPQGSPPSSSSHENESFGWEHDHPGEIFVPPSGWDDDIIKNIASSSSSQNQTRRTWAPQANYKQEYYYPTGRSLDDDDGNGESSLSWRQYYAHKDRKEIYDIIHTAFLK